MVVLVKLNANELTAKLLRWLASFPGGSWQQRWDASKAEDHPGSSWVQLPLR